MSTRIATCRLCGGRLEYRRRRFAWVHVTKHGGDHPPVPREVRETDELELTSGTGEGL